MKNKCRFISVILVAAMLVSLLPMSVFAAKPNGLKTKDGYLWVEAESLKFNKDTFEKNKNKEMWSGGSALAIKDGVKDPTPAASEEADIDLSFTADANGTYTVWTRNTARQTNGAGNSIWLSVEGEEYKYFRVAGNTGEPAWTKLASVNVEEGKTASVRIKARQVIDIAFDLFIITKDASFRPVDQNTGLGDLIGIPVRSTPAPLEVDESGTFIVEAENLREYNTDVYSVVEDEAASGGKAITALAEDKNDPYSGQTADVDLSFKAAKPGSYNIWCRARTTGNVGSSTIFLSSKKENGDYRYFALISPAKEYAWTKLATIPVLDTDSIGYLRICRRHADTIRLDKFVITNSLTFAPTGKDDEPSENTEIIMPEGIYNKPTITPVKGEHPRLWFHKEDIPKIKENMQNPQSENAVKSLNEFMNNEIDITEKWNRGKHWDTIEALAFDYAINGNREHGRKAIESYLTIMPFADYTGDNFETRQYGGAISVGTRVYDWCYDLMSEEEKKEMIEQMEAKCLYLTIGYPPRQGKYITGHYSEGMMLEALMSLAIATYDERPDIYNYIMGKFFDEYIAPRNYWYQSHSYHQGTGYVAARFMWDIHAALMIKKSLGAEVFNMEDMRKSVYELIYLSRPDGQHFRVGDDYFTGSKVGTYWGSYGQIMQKAAELFDDEYLKREQTRCDPNYNPTYTSEQREMTPALFILTNNYDIGEKLRDDLPLTMYSPSPNGQMIARTGWNDGYDAPDVVAYMKIGELYASNHAHLDMGHFQLYYKGILASDSGVYSGYGAGHHTVYQKASIAHNIITVFDPDEDVTGRKTYNDGGYLYPENIAEPETFDLWKEKYFMAEVTGHEYGPDMYTPEYNYLAGDLTKAYSANGVSDKVSESLRSMVFMPLDDKDHPGALVVFDKITSKNKAHKKSWLLHMQEEPQVDGNKTIVTRTEYGNNGRMVNETLLPKSVNIEKIGGFGKQFWINGENVGTQMPSGGVESGWGRVEISPKEASNTDFFLNVMTVSDADTTAPDIESTLVENDSVAGAVFADKAVVFNRNKPRLEGGVSFTMPEGSYDLLVCGLKAGTWDVNGTEAIANEDGGCIYVKVNGGDITLTYKNDNANKTFTSNALTAPSEKIGVRVDGGYIYSDVDPVIVNDRTLVPMRAIFEKLEAEVSYDGATSTATAVKDGKTIQITEGSNTAYVNGEAVELDVAATIINDRFVVPIRFVSESFGATVEWSELSKTVMITKPKEIIIVKPNHNPTEPNEIKVVDVKESSYEGGSASEAGYGMDKSLDGKFETRWAVEGDDYENTWGIYDFGSVYTLDKFGIAFWKSGERKSYFTVKVSEDGSNWTTVLNKVKSNDFLPNESIEYFNMNDVKARYFKIECGGNSVNAWNSILEVKFIKK